VGALGIFDIGHGISFDEFLAEKMTKECPDTSAAGLNRERRDFRLLRPVEWVIAELVRILQCDDEPPQVMGCYRRNIRVASQKPGEVYPTLEVTQPIVRGLLRSALAQIL
jgi:hypothetical protein